MKEKRFQELVQKIAKEEGVKICDPSRISKLAAALRAEGVEIEEERELEISLYKEERYTDVKCPGWFFFRLHRDGKITAHAGAAPKNSHPFQAAPGSGGRVAIEGYQWVGEEEEGEYVLRLTKREAQVVRALLGTCGTIPGAPTNTAYRKAEKLEGGKGWPDFREMFYGSVAGCPQLREKYHEP